MNGPRVCHTEGSQKEKNKYIISLMYRIYKNNRGELICKAEVENGRMGMGARGGMNWQNGIDIYTVLCIIIDAESNQIFRASCQRKYKTKTS